VSPAIAPRGIGGEQTGDAFEECRLAAPFGPIIPRISPDATPKETSRAPADRQNALPTPLTVIRASVVFSHGYFQDLISTVIVALFKAVLAGAVGTR